MDISLENLYVDIWAERANFEDSVCSINLLIFFEVFTMS